ncbi:MAG: biotin--[acetyl-CoA-carboxylase] ligase [Bradymonadales bacterium]|nr:biotin--[acetyl-CoA-carboxylase] ligase [Bradymonadales bacterium]
MSTLLVTDSPIETTRFLEEGCLWAPLSPELTRPELVVLARRAGTAAELFVSSWRSGSAGGATDDPPPRDARTRPSSPDRKEPSFPGEPPPMDPPSALPPVGQLAELERPGAATADGPADPSGSSFWSLLFLTARAPRSQFDLLKDLPEQDWTFPGPVACLALAGTGFHGQHGREWETSPGNLHLSIGISCDLPVHRTGHNLVQLPAVAALEALRQLVDAPSELSIKWINDLMIKRKKVGGVLTAARMEGDRIRRLVCGIGINVSSTPAIPPTPFVPAAGCLADLDPSLAHALPSLLWALLDTLASQYQRLVDCGPESLFESYRKNSSILGRKVRIYGVDFDPQDRRTWHPPIASGRVQEIRPDLTLVLEGEHPPILNGRLAFEEDCLAFGL